MNDFYTLLTNTGINAIITARASNKEVKLSKIAVGDGDIIPAQNMTALKSEKHRFSINSIIQDPSNPNYLIIEGVIPSNIGGFYISEIAIYTDTDVLFAIGSLPKTYKPLLEEGSAKDLTIKVFLEVTNVDTVTLKVDDSVVLATRKFVTSELKKHTEDKKNPHNVTKDQVGLENVDNTSDENKPLSKSTISELKKYALKNGDKTQTFNVKDATQATEAVSKKQLDAIAETISKLEIIPKGLISMWSGTITKIPSGWALCNGSNGTPDLRDKFVIGAGTSYDIGATGGSKDAIVVAHAHAQSSHSHTATETSAGAHTHALSIDANGAHAHGGNNAIGTHSGGDGNMPLRGHTVVGYQAFTTTSAGAHGHTGTAISAGGHTHSITNNAVAPAIASTGKSGTNANLPPYYALAFIMKI